jgi:hypothetical protein
MSAIWKEDVAYWKARALKAEAERDKWKAKYVAERQSTDRFVEALHLPKAEGGK